jgi:hypothetical protein
VNAVTVDASGRMFVVGQFSSSTLEHMMGGDSDTLSSMLDNTLSSGGTYDGFVARLVYSSSTLDVSWSELFGGQRDDFATAVTADGTGKELELRQHILGCACSVGRSVGG